MKLKFVYPALWRDTVNTERNYLWSLQEHDCAVVVPGRNALAAGCETIAQSLDLAAREGAWVIASPRTWLAVTQRLDELANIIVLDFTDDELRGMFSRGKNARLLAKAKVVFRTNLLYDKAKLRQMGFSPAYFSKVHYIPLPPRLPRGVHPQVDPVPCKVFYMCRPTHVMRVRVVARLREALGADFVGGFSNLEILQEGHRYWQPIRDELFPVLEKYPDLARARLSNQEFHAHLAGAEVALIVRGMAIQDYRTHAFLHYRKPIVRDSSIVRIHDFIDPVQMALFNEDNVADVVMRSLAQSYALPEPPPPMSLADYSRVVVRQCEYN